MHTFYTTINRFNHQFNHQRRRYQEVNRPTQFAEILNLGATRIDNPEFGGIARCTALQILLIQAGHHINSIKQKNRTITSQVCCSESIAMETKIPFLSGRHTTTPLIANFPNKTLALVIVCHHTNKTRGKATNKVMTHVFNRFLREDLMLASTE